MMINLQSTLLIGAMCFISFAQAQIPKNDEKEFEYHAETSVKKAGTGDLVKRLAHWAEHYFPESATVKVMVDDTNQRYVEVDVKEKLVDSHFGVNRSHTERIISYHIKFDTDRKDYSYWINDFHYQALETDHKNRETRHDAPLSEIKSAASKSLLEDIHGRMTSMIESFMAAAEEELVE